MTKEQLEKYEDYVDGFLALEGTAAYPVGALVSDEKNLKEIMALLKDRSMSTFDEPDLKKNAHVFFDTVNMGTAVAIQCENEFSPHTNNLLLNFAHGNIRIEIPGKGMKTINPVPKSSKVVLVMAEEVFDSSTVIGKVASSVCRL